MYSNFAMTMVAIPDNPQVCSAIQCTTLHYTALLCAAVYCSVLHCLSTCTLPYKGQPNLSDYTVIVSPYKRGSTQQSRAVLRCAVLWFCVFAGTNTATAKAVVLPNLLRFDVIFMARHGK